MAKIFEKDINDIHMFRYVSGWFSFSGVLHHFLSAKLATSSIRVTSN